MKEKKIYLYKDISRRFISQSTILVKIDNLVSLSLNKYAVSQKILVRKNYLEKLTLPNIIKS